MQTSVDEILRCLRRMDVSFAVADAASGPSVRRAADKYGKLQVNVYLCVSSCLRESWRDSVSPSPTQLIRASEDGLLWTLDWTSPNLFLVDLAIVCIT